MKMTRVIFSNIFLYVVIFCLILAQSSGAVGRTNTGDQLLVNRKSIVILKLFNVCPRAAQAIYSQIDGLFNAMTRIIERRFGHFDKKIERLAQTNFVSRNCSSR